MELAGTEFDVDLRQRIRQVAFEGTQLVKENKCLPRLTKPRHGVRDFDFVLPAVLFRSVDAHGLSNEVVHARLKDHAVSLFIERCIVLPSNNDVAIALDRARVAKHLISSVLKAGDAFGDNLQRADGRNVLFSVAGLWHLPTSADEMSIDCLRSSLAAMHLLRLAQSRGYDAKMTLHTSTSSSRSLLAAVMRALFGAVVGVSDSSVNVLADIAEALVSHQSGGDRKEGHIAALNSDLGKGVLSYLQTMTSENGGQFNGQQRILWKWLERLTDEELSNESLSVMERMSEVPSLGHALDRVRCAALASVEEVLSKFELPADIVDSCPLSRDVLSCSQRKRRLLEEAVRDLLKGDVAPALKREVSDKNDFSVERQDDMRKENVTNNQMSDGKCDECARPCVHEEKVTNNEERRHFMKEENESAAGGSTDRRESKAGDQDLRRHLVGSTFVLAEKRDSAEKQCIGEDLQGWSLPRVNGKILLDLQALLSSRNLSVGKGGFDNGLKTALVRDTEGYGTTYLHHAAFLHSSTRAVQPPVTVHVVSSSHHVAVQKADLTWRFLSGDSSYSQHQMYCVLSPVLSMATSGSCVSGLSLGDYLRQRRSQMVEAAQIKFGAKANSDYVQRCIHAMTIATIKFELLSSPANHSVKVNLLSDVNAGCDTGQGGVQESRCGTFVLYNYARLSTLWNNFQKDVSKGVYPDLPPVENIDFSHLSDESEWHLLLQYILDFPQMLHDALPLADGSISSSGIRLNCALNKVCLFLTQFCRELSTYYSRVRILEEPSAHRFCVIHARLYLLLAIKQVLRNGLALLSIEPFDQV